MNGTLRRLLRRERASVKGELEGGKLIRKVGRRGKAKGLFNTPCGTAVTRAGDIIVADTENHRIQIFSADGAFKHRFGTKGCRPDQVSYPMCVAVTPDDLIAVTDSVNAAVKVFTIDGSLQRQHGAPGELEFPYGVACSPDGHLVVTDICKHCVSVFKPEGQLSHAFGSYGDKARELDHPYFVTVTSDRQIVVSDAGNSCIKIFHFLGRLLRCFTFRDFRLPEENLVSLYGLCTDSDGNTLVVCNSTVYIVTKNGRLWEVVTPKDGLTAPKCVAFSPHGRLVVTQADYDGNHELCIFRYNTEDYKSLNTLIFYAISI